MASREEAVSDLRGWRASLSTLEGHRRAPYSRLPVPGLVAAPYQSVGGEPVEINSFRMADNSSPCPPSLASVNPPASAMRQPPASAEGRPRAAASSCPTPPVDEHERTHGERMTDRGTPPCPRVLILSSDERRLSSLSPFQRRERCDKLGKVVRCEKLIDGGL